MPARDTGQEFKGRREVLSTHALLGERRVTQGVCVWRRERWEVTGGEGGHVAEENAE